MVLLVSVIQDFNVTTESDHKCVISHSVSKFLIAVSRGQEMRTKVTICMGLMQDTQILVPWSCHRNFCPTKNCPMNRNFLSYGCPKFCPRIKIFGGTIFS